MVETKITVVMTAFNAEKYVSEAIESILTQTETNFKFIIVDNGSEDSTSKIIENFAKKDQRISFFQRFGKSTYVDGRGYAIDKVDTEWFAIMDADDISEPTRIERQLEYIEKYGSETSVFGTWGYSINNLGNIVSKIEMGPLTIKEYDTIISKNEAIVPLDPSTVIKKETFVKAGGYRSETAPAADLDLWYRISEQGKSILIIPERLVRYRIHTESTSVHDSMHQRLKTHYINYNTQQKE